MANGIGSVGKRPQSSKPNQVEPELANEAKSKAGAAAAAQTPTASKGWQPGGATPQKPNWPAYDAKYPLAADFHDKLQKLDFTNVDTVTIDTLANEAITPTLDTGRMWALNRFARAGSVFWQGHGDTSVYLRGATQAVAMFWGMPRDLAGAEKSGQSFTESFSPKARHNVDPSPFTLSVKGNAEQAYTLKFKLSETAVSVRIPKGATPAETGRLVAEAINGSVDDIMQTQSPYKNKSIEGNSGAYASLKDLKATADGSGNVSIAVNCWDQ